MGLYPRPPLPPRSLFPPSLIECLKATTLSSDCIKDSFVDFNGLKEKGRFFSLGLVPQVGNTSIVLY